MSFDRTPQRFLALAGVPALDAGIELLVEQRCGADYLLTLIDIMEARSGGDLTADIYPHLFAAAHSAIVTAAWAVDLTVEAMQLVRDWHQRGSTVVDVGCGAGLISTYLAWADPTAVVTGVDSCPQAVAAAAEIAARLQGRNVSFVVGDVMASPSEQFDEVVTVTVAVELEPAIREAAPTTNRFSLIGQIEERPGASSPSPVASALVAWGSRDASLISVERLSDPVSAARWWNSLEAAGWHVDGTESRGVFFGGDHRQCLPAFRARQGVDRPMVSPHEQMRWWDDHLGGDDALGSELRLAALEDVKVCSTSIVDGGGVDPGLVQVLLMEPDEVYVWVATSSGQRQLIQWFLEELDEALDQAEMIAEQIGGAVRHVTADSVLTDPGDV